MPKPSVRLRPRDPASLASGYTPGVRHLERLGILAYAGLMVAWGVRLSTAWWEDPWVMLAAFASGYLAADLVSGMVHWAADSWGSADLPLIGPAFLRPFREHHVDPEAITRHDLVETNGNNCLASLPVVTLALFIPIGSSLGLFTASFLGMLTLWLMATNQFHKWAHLREPTGWVAFLQRVHLILPPQHHTVHHTAPFHRYYCITTGWLNAPLTWMRFFPTLEWLITGVTGWLPRTDDLGEYNALVVQAEEEKEQAMSRPGLRVPGAKP